MIRIEGINKVAVIGAGVMGEGIAQSFAEAGLSVRLVDLDEQALSRCMGQIASNLQQSAQYELLNDAPETILDRISTRRTDGVASDVGGCGLIVETAPELIDVKRSIFAALDVLPEEVLLASNTSSFTVTQLTEGMRTPERVVGLHYFNPAHIIPAVEIHRGEHTDASAIMRVRELMRRIGKIPVIVKKEVPGFVINRLTGALSREIDYLLDEGVVDAYELDAAVKASLGFRLAQIGPMEAEDFIGLDTDARASANIFPTLSNGETPSTLLIEKVERGDLGVKTGKGWYDYTDGSRTDALNARNKKLLEQRRLFDAALKTGAALAAACQN